MQTQQCPGCGKVLAPGAPPGFCPPCLLRLGSTILPPSPTHRSSSAAEPDYDESEFLPGSQPRFLGEYELIEEIARGGMGIVYRAHHRTLNRQVALKLVVAGNLAGKDALRRFRIEAQAGAALDHPNIVPVYEIGEAETLPFFTMKLVEGGNMTHHLDTLVLPGTEPGRKAVAFRRRQEKIAAFMIKVARAVAYAHHRGVLHRDLKPSNILMDSSGDPQVSDFGLAKILEGENHDLTLSASILGSPSYMAPEQARGDTQQEITTATDVYGLGALLYHLLTGRPPFTGNSVLEILGKVVDDEPEPPSHFRPALNRDLETICLSCLRKNPANRYRWAADVADELERFLQGKPIEARRISASERALKWARRRRAALSMILAVFLGLTGIIGLLIVDHFRVTKERSRTERARQALADRVVRLEMERCEALFASGASSAAIARLAYVLRAYPDSVLLFQRLRSALQSRRFVAPQVELSEDGPIHAASLSPDGTQIVSALKHNAAAVRDARTGKRIALLPHDGSVLAVAFSPDGERVLTASEDGTARLWNAASGLPTGAPMTHTAAIIEARFSNDGTMVITGSNDHTARVWEAASGTPLTAPLQHVGYLLDVRFHPDDLRVVTVDTTGQAQLWNVATGQRLGDPFAGAIHARFSPDGQLLLTFAGSQARLWDLASGKLLHAFTHLAWVNAARFSPDGQLVATASEDRTAALWNTTSGERVTPLMQHRSAVHRLAFLPDGQQLVTGSLLGNTHVWDTASGRAAFDGVPHLSGIVAIEAAQDGKGVLTASLDGQAQLWELPQRRQKRLRFARQFDAVNAAQFSDDGTMIAVATGLPGSGQAVVLDCRSGRMIGQRLLHADVVRDVCFSHDSRMLATVSHDESVCVWNVRSGLLLYGPFDHDDWPLSARFSPDDAILATSGVRSGVRLFSVTGKKQFPPYSPLAGPALIAFDPGGTRLLVADAAVHILDLPTGGKTNTFLAHKHRITDARWSRDGSRILTADAGGWAQIWHTATGKVLLEKRQHQGTILTARFNPDETAVVTAGLDGTARVWDARTGTTLVAPLQHPLAVRHAEFTPDGRTVVTASEDASARIWEATSGLQATEPMLHPAPILFARMDAAGRSLFTACTDGTAFVWDLEASLPTHGQAPSWFADFAESLCGFRLNTREILEPVTTADRQATRQKISALKSTDSLTQWAQSLMTSP